MAVHDLSVFQFLLTAGDILAIPVTPHIMADVVPCPAEASCGVSLHGGNHAGIYGSHRSVGIFQTYFCSILQVNFYAIAQTVFFIAEFCKLTILAVIKRYCTVFIRRTSRVYDLMPIVDVWIVSNSSRGTGRRSVTVIHIVRGKQVIPVLHKLNRRKRGVVPVLSLNPDCIFGIRPGKAVGSELGRGKHNFRWLVIATCFIVGFTSRQHHA